MCVCVYGKSISAAKEHQSDGIKTYFPENSSSKTFYAIKVNSSSKRMSTGILMYEDMDKMEKWLFYWILIILYVVGVNNINFI